MTDDRDVVCPEHGKPLTLLEEGVLNGVWTGYYGLCPGADPRGRPVTCQYHHQRGTRDPAGECACRDPIPPAPCRREVRVADESHEEPPLFADVDATEEQR